MIERNDLCVSKMAGKAPAHVSGAGANVDNGKRLLFTHEVPHHPKQSIMTAEPAVYASDIAKIPVRRLQASILQQLCAQDATSTALPCHIYLPEVCFR
jgi:hypothetical protein